MKRYLVIFLGDNKNLNSAFKYSSSGNFVFSIIFSFSNARNLSYPITEPLTSLIISYALKHVFEIKA